MGWGGAGLKVLRWVLWVLFGWVFLRGIVTFLPDTSPGNTVPAGSEAQIVAEPAGLRSFPALFAREFFTWEPGKTGDRAARLQPYLAQSLDRHAGWSAGRDGVGQTAEGTWVHSVKPLANGRYLVTVAVRVDPYEETAAMEGNVLRTTRKALPGSVQYLAVPVARSQSGGWVVYDYPSLVTVPDGGAFTGPVHSGQEVADSGDRVRTLATGFFRAYLGGSDDLSYFLDPGTRLRASATSLSFQSVGRVTLVAAGAGHEALVEVLAIDPVTGARFTYRYTLTLTERDGRWYVKDLSQRGE